MKSRPIMMALAMSATALSAQEEVKKPEPAQPAQPAVNGEVKIGPVTVAVATASTAGPAVEKKEPYLGVVTEPLSPQLRAQLGIPEGMGLSVEAVAKGGPAEKAGLQKYDVLKKFNDQLLTSSDHLATLVKAAGKGTKVSLTLVRKGAEQVVDVTIGEHTTTANGTFALSFGDVVPGVSVQIQNLDQALQGIANGIQDKWKPQPGAKPGAEEIEKMRMHRERIEQQVRDATRKAQEAAEKAKQAAKNAAPKAGGQVYSYYAQPHTQSTIVIKNGDLEITISETNGKRQVKINDGGAETFSGPLNTEKDHDAVPDKYRDKVLEAEKKLKGPDKKGDGHEKPSI